MSVIPLLGQADKPHAQPECSMELRTVEPSDVRRILIIPQFNTSNSKRDSTHSTEKFRLHIPEESKHRVSNSGVSEHIDLI